MNKERFLLYLLGGIFASQIALFSGTAIWCMTATEGKACPNIAATYEKTFNVMIATTLALLTGASLSSTTKN